MAGDAPQSERLRTFPLPPRGFRIMDATKEERAGFGLPESDAAAAWLSQILGGDEERYEWITPKFTPRAAKRSRFLTRMEAPGLLPALPQKNPFWAGGVTFPKPGDRAIWVGCSWPVADVSLPGAPKPGAVYCAAQWVGMDGYIGQHDVLQAGCDSFINANGQKRFEVWFEWWPGATNWRAEIPVTAGDMLSVQIALHGSLSFATVTIVNQTHHQAYPFIVTAQPGTSLRGDSAEWVVETNPTLGPLACFNDVIFQNCTTGTLQGVTLPAASGTCVDMVAPNGQVVCSSVLLNPTTIKVSYQLIPLAPVIG